MCSIRSQDQEGVLGTDKTAGTSFDYLFTQGRTSLCGSSTQAYDFNAAGKNVVTATFMPLLLKSADPRLIFVTRLSQMTQVAEAYFPTPPLSAGWPKKAGLELIGYLCSKTAPNIMVPDGNHKLNPLSVLRASNPLSTIRQLTGLTFTGRRQGTGSQPWSPGDQPRGPGRRNHEAAECCPLGVSAQLVLDIFEGKRGADVGKVVGRDGLMSFWADRQPLCC